MSVTMFVITMFVCLLALLPGKLTAAVVKLSVKTGDDSDITPTNSPGGSTLQWGADQVCFASQHLLCPRPYGRGH